MHFMQDFVEQFSWPHHRVHLFNELCRNFKSDLILHLNVYPRCGIVRAGRPQTFEAHVNEHISGAPLQARPHNVCPQLMGNVLTCQIIAGMIQTLMGLGTRWL